MVGKHCTTEQDFRQVPVAHICNPSYSGGRDKEGYRAQANSSPDPISKKKKKKAGGGTQGVGPEFKP
jgi:hypothetical protein